MASMACRGGSHVRQSRVEVAQVAAAEFVVLPFPSKRRRGGQGQCGRAPPLSTITSMAGVHHWAGRQAGKGSMHAGVDRGLTEGRHGKHGQNGQAPGLGCLSLLGLPT